MYENLHKERSFSFYLWETVKLGGKIEYEGLKIRKNFGGRDLKWEKLYDKKQNYISLLEKHRLRKRLLSFFVIDIIEVIIIISIFKKIEFQLGYKEGKILMQKEKQKLVEEWTCIVKVLCKC